MKAFTKFLKTKPIKVVTRAALMKIADGIYNPKTGYYLNLCDGTLQNGPDPACEKRPMHCGLGELFFVVTGEQPEDAGVCEAEVVSEVIRRSTIQKSIDVEIKKIEALGLQKELADKLIEQVRSFDHTDKLEDLLGSIPTNNDNATTFKARAKNVAAILRKAAELLPE